MTLFRQTDTERTGDSRIEEKHYTYDALGNVVRERLTRLGVPGRRATVRRERSTELVYAAEREPYLSASRRRMFA